MLRSSIEKGNLSINKNDNSYDFSYPCTSHSDCSPYEVIFQRGVFLIELWGAQGGEETKYNIPGGKGGFVSGYLTIRSTKRLFLYIGASGLAASNLNTFGGGGKGTQGLTENTPGGSGGGATDLRFKYDDLSSRFAVAGGGAGSSYYRGNLPGGDAGGLTGFNGEYGRCSTSYTPSNVGCGGQQNNSYPSTCRSGEIGIGGNSGTQYGSGGGGGYFGGGNGASVVCSVSSGGGGSSYISGNPKCATIPSFILKNTVIKSGRDSFLSPSGITSTGNTGNGHARITFCGSPGIVTCKIVLSPHFLGLPMISFIISIH